MILDHAHNEPNDPLWAARWVGRALRQRLGAWCGLLLPGGEVVPLGGGAGPVPCALLKVRQDALGSCERSVRAWADASQWPLGQLTETSCHAGLRALLRPLRGPSGEAAGVLFLAGFWDEARAEEGSRLLKARWAALELKGDPRPAPSLDPTSRAWVGFLLEEAAQAVEAAWAKRPPAASLSPARARYRDIIGHSKPLLELFRTLDKISVSDSTVLIEGENGTGKELIARAIHAHSKRKDRQFVAQNCSALNDNLLDSEFFGHKKGSFTGAMSDKQGLFDLAHGGTFFLDEVGDMSPALQVKMLRVLQEGTFLPVGGTVVRKVDVRVIAATNRDLKAMVREGSFREDLYYRLNVINLVVPSLRERREDIPALADHFFARTVRRMNIRPKGLAAETLRRLVAHDWPGTVRELENEVERLVVLAGDGAEVGPELLSPKLRGLALSAEADPNAELPDALEALERKMLLDGLKKANWNKTRAAAELGISRRNLIRKVERYQLDKQRSAPS